MNIGEVALKLADRKVSELDSELISLTGLCAAEIREGLRYPCLAGTVASALLPLLAEPLERHALAEAIDQTGVSEVRVQVLALYDKILAKEAANGEAKA